MNSILKVKKILYAQIFLPLPIAKFFDIVYNIVIKGQYAGMEKKYVRNE